MGSDEKNIFASAIIPARNAERWIAEAVDSVLAQDRDDIEVIVVDDGSTDGTADILAGYGPPVRVISQTNQGVSAARNRALLEAGGQWAAFLDADDRWLPGHISAIAKAARRQPEAGLVYTDAVVIDGNGNRVKNKPSPGPGENPFFTILLANRITTSAAAVRRAVLEKVGVFVEGLKSGASCEDWDLWLRVALESPVVHVPRVTVEYRRQEDSAVQSTGMSIRDDNLYVLSRAEKLSPIPAPLLKKARGNCYLESAVRLLTAAQTSAARVELFRALRHRPFLPSAWALLPVTLAGPRFAERALKWKRQREEGR